MNKKRIDNKILKDDVENLDLNTNICLKLKTNEIDTIGKLCNHTRKELRNLDFVQSDIQSIVIKLQLKGLDIKGNEYLYKNSTHFLTKKFKKCS